MKVYLDFDGVFIDSAFEAFRISLASLNIIQNPGDNTKDHYYQQFLKYRPYVGPAWNYKFVLDSMLLNTELSIPQVVTDEALIFEENFFKTRRIFRKMEAEKWISLHKPYTFAGQFQEKFQSSLNQFIFLTNKNKDAVETILELLLPPVNSLEVISTTDFDSKMTKGDILNLIEDEDVFFIDDSIHICEDVSLKNKNVKVFNAKWGYSTKADQTSSFVDVMDEEEILEKII